MVGQTISHYRIEKEIGSGGMGVVYQAFDERLQRAVALKVLPDAISSHSERWARILAEARAASALNHPGITTIYEVGEDGEHLFLVMELLTGRTLREELHAGPIETRRLLRIGGQIADALAVAHEQGIVHGDIKPENIVLLPDGRVKLLDFGIARQIAAETLTVTRTQTHAWMGDSAIAGTLAYMAPEALRGESTDARADLFSLGIMLYEMAAGSRPFPGPTATALVAQIQNDAPAPLGRVAPGTPPELARVVGKLLQKEVTSRYQSVREVHVDLNNLARDLEVGASLPAAVAGKRAVAVLPFKLLTPNTEDEYLSVALADAIINQLGADGELLVRPTSTVLRYAKQANDPIAAARELNVNVVVDGSIQKFGQQLRVHVQAWDADDGSTIASAKHDSELTGLFALQDEIAGTLARALGSKAGAGKKKKEEPPTTNPMAYELYLRGVDRLMRLNRWDTRTAIEMLQNAVLLDPGFADAWARLGEGCVLMAGTFEPGPAWVARAERAVRKALSLDRLNAEAHVARGRLVWTPAKKFQHRTALRALRDALRYSPGTHQALVWSGCILMHIGLMEEAKESLLTALGTNPDDAFTLIFLAQANLYLGKYDDTDPYEERVLVQDRANLWANLFGGVAPLYRNDLAKAERFIRSAEQVLPGDPMLLACEGLLWAKRGEKKKAEPLLARAVRNPKSMLHTHHMVHMAAAAHAVLGQKQKALALLRKSAINGLPNYPMFANDPHFTPYHREPAFLKLMAELRKEWTGYVKEFGSKASAAKV